MRGKAKRWRRSVGAALTQPELIIHVAEAGRVVLPVPVEVQLSTLPSEENLRGD